MRYVRYKPRSQLIFKLSTLPMQGAVDNLNINFSWVKIPYIFSLIYLYFPLLGFIYLNLPI